MSWACLIVIIIIVVVVGFTTLLSMYLLGNLHISQTNGTM